MEVRFIACLAKVEKVLVTIGSGMVTDSISDLCGENRFCCVVLECDLERIRAGHRRILFADPRYIGTYHSSSACSWLNFYR
jgi:hypothetical protein